MRVQRLLRDVSILAIGGSVIMLHRWLCCSGTATEEPTSPKAAEPVADAPPPSPKAAETIATSSMPQGGDVSVQSASQIENAVPASQAEEEVVASAPPNKGEACTVDNDEREAVDVESATLAVTEAVPVASPPPPPPREFASRFESLLRAKFPELSVVEVNENALPGQPLHSRFMTQLLAEDEPLDLFLHGTPSVNIPSILQHSLIRNAPYWLSDDIATAKSYALKLETYRSRRQIAEPVPIVVFVGVRRLLRLNSQVGMERGIYTTTSTVLPLFMCHAPYA